jgi:UDP-N-acetylglucosamine transferase subunit ALG13
MILITVGSQEPFDRMIKVVDEACVTSLDGDEIICQSGNGGYKPRFKCVPFMQKDEFDDCFRRADIIVSHAGMGNLLMSLKYGKPTIFFPRLLSKGEHRSNHQEFVRDKFNNVEFFWFVETKIEFERAKREVQLLGRVDSCPPVASIALIQSLKRELGLAQ